MGRKTIRYTVTVPPPEEGQEAKENRDKGKVYLITELPASQAEEWATRAFLALANAEVDIPDELTNSGMAGVARLGLKMLNKMRFEDVKPLLDIMMSCVQRIPDPSRPEATRSLNEDDIEEVSTRLQLRKEVFTLHTGFFGDAVPSDSKLTTETTAITQDMPIFRKH